MSNDYWKIPSIYKGALESFQRIFEIHKKKEIKGTLFHFMSRFKGLQATIIGDSRKVFLTGFVSYYGDEIYEFEVVDESSTVLDCMSCFEVLSVDKIRINF